MWRARYLFPAAYFVLLLVATLASSMNLKLFVVLTCLGLALLVNRHPVSRFLVLFVTALGTLVPLLVFVQSTICSSLMPSKPLALCTIERSATVLLNVGLLTSIFILAAANEWRGSLVETVNGMYLPRNVRIMAIVSGAMIGEFRRAIIRVHHAFTARGEAVPAVSWRNFLALPSMLGVVWAAVLTGVVERINGQWSSDRFWARYVPSWRRRETVKWSDLIVVATCGGLIGIVLDQHLR